MSRPNIELHIDALVLRGFPALDGAILGQVAERELTRLLAEDGAPPGLAHGGATDRLDGGAFQAAPGMGDGELGVRIARAVYRGLGR